MPENREGKRDAPALRWRHENLAWNGIDRAAMKNQRFLFYLLAIASFVEITTDLYTRNLIDYYAGDDAVQDWLANGWEPEEMQHGRALRRYVTTVWSDFDWDGTYRRFFEEYRECCRVELLGPTRALEMARRCIVETGTCSYYTMIRRLSPCPVLAELARNICTDEAGHYRHFHTYYERYREAEKPSRPTIMKTLWQRIREINGEDGYIAFKHVWTAANPGHPFDSRMYRRFMRALRGEAVAYYPFHMAVHMATRPLGFGSKTQRRVTATLSAGARFIARATGTSAATVN